MSVTGIPIKATEMTFINPNFQFPNPRQISNSQIQKKQCRYPLFGIIDEKISVSSRASAASLSRAATLPFVNPASTNRKNRRRSFASLRQIFARIRKSFLLSTSSASTQFAAAEPDARTNCLTSSVLLTVLGSPFTNVRTDSANRNVLSSRSRGLAPSSILDLGFDRLLGIWVLGFGICRCCDNLLRCVGEIVRRD